MSRAKQAKEVATSLQNVGNKAEESYLRALAEFHARINGEVVSETVKAWHRDFRNNLKTVSSLPEVRKSTFRDARKLFGPHCDSKVILRKPDHQGTFEGIVLLQFDPNFMSTEVVCRHPSCSNKNPVAAKSGKRDLYLCPNHQQVLRNRISNALAKNNIKISRSAEKPAPGHFSGYTSLISLLEGAYYDAKKFGTLKGKSPMVEEAILNVRNFLLITSAVLNPDEVNLGIALPPVVEILLVILQNPLSFGHLVVTLTYLLREVIETILFAFGVIYTWVSLALGSPGAQIGAGIGAAIGAIASVLGPWGGAAGVAVGGAIGGLIGNGIYNLGADQQRQREINQFREYWRNAGGAGANGDPNNQYPVYYFHGDTFGGLDLHPFLAAVILNLFL